MRAHFDKVLATISSIFLATTLYIIAVTPPATGYEISIYDAFPSYFWFCIIASITCGIFILINQAFTAQKSRWWIFGLSIVILSDLIIILLPISRGYFISTGADEITHLELIKDIVVNGHIENSNFYPISHILSFEISSICRLDSRLVIKIVPSIFFLIYMAGLYLLAKEIGKKSGHVFLVMAFSSVLLFTYFNYCFLPTQFFVFLIPLILFLFLRKNSLPSLSRATILIIVLLPLPFLHPLGSVFLLAIFLLYELSVQVYRFLRRKNHAPDSTTFTLSGMALGPAIIVFAIFFLWFSTFALFRTTVRQAYEWFVYGYGVPPIETIGMYYQMANFTIIKFLDLLIKNYGHFLLFSLLSLIAIITILMEAFYRRNSLKMEEIFFSLIFLFFGLFYLSTLLGAFISTGRSLRIFCWPLVASTMLNGIFYHERIWKMTRIRSKICLSLLTVIIISATIIGVFSVYPSPNIKIPNPQVTRMEWCGMEWFFNHKTSQETICFDQLPYRYARVRARAQPESVGVFSKVPLHLGYDKNESLADYFNSNPYIIVNERIRADKTELWPDHGIYTLNDLNRLSTDTAVSRVYFNGELEILQVSSRVRE